MEALAVVPHDTQLVLRKLIACRVLYRSRQLKVGVFPQLCKLPAIASHLSETEQELQATADLLVYLEWTKASDCAFVFFCYFSIDLSPCTYSSLMVSGTSVTYRDSRPMLMTCGHEQSVRRPLESTSNSVLMDVE